MAKRQKIEYFCDKCDKVIEQKDLITVKFGSEKYEYCETCVDAAKPVPKPQPTPAPEPEPTPE